MPSGPQHEFDLEAAIRSWRSEARSKHIRNGRLEELERHLRDAIENLIAAGKPAREAYQRAMSDLGTPDQLAGEFAKDGRFRFWDFLVLALTGAGLAYVFAVAMPASFGRASVPSTPMLNAHVFAFGTGVLFAIAAGICGVYVLTRRDLSGSKNTRVETLYRRVVLGMCALVLLGSVAALVTGLIFARDSGVSAPWYDYRHLGNSALILWSAATLAFAWCGKLNTRWHFVSAIIGSLIVSDFLLLGAIVEGYFGITAILLGIFFYTVQLVPLLRHWEARPEDRAVETG